MGDAREIAHALSGATRSAVDIQGFRGGAEASQATNRLQTRRSAMRENSS
jgi:hypothetical protein